MFIISLSHYGLINDNNAVSLLRSWGYRKAISHQSWNTTVGSRILFPARHLILITFYLGRRVCVLLFRSHDYINTACSGKGTGEGWGKAGSPLSPFSPLPGASGGGSEGVRLQWGPSLHPTSSQHFCKERIFFLNLWEWKVLTSTLAFENTTTSNGLY